VCSPVLREREEIDEDDFCDMYVFYELVTDLSSDPIVCKL